MDESPPTNTARDDQLQIWRMLPCTGGGKRVPTLVWKSGTVRMLRLSSGEASMGVVDAAEGGKLAIKCLWRIMMS